MTPVPYSQANQQIVDGYNARPPAAGDFVYWDEDAVSPVRKQIKDHYIAEQQQKCCYCDRVYPTGNNAVWDGEHVIPKSLAAKFLFEPRNLAASCKDCNIAKGDTEVRLTPPTRVSFPNQSRHYKIVHPHFDNYSDHIRWFGDAARSLTAKGSKLIGICNLTRFGHLKIGADPAPPNPVFGALVGTLMDPQATRVDLDIAIAGIRQYVKTIPQK